MRGMALVGRGVALVGLVVTSGCFWSMPGANPDRQAYNRQEDVLGPAVVAELTEAWRAPTDAGPVGDPVASRAGLHAVGGSTVYGFDRDGDRLWAVPSPAPLRLSEPYVDGTTLRVGRWNPTATEGSEIPVNDVTLQVDVRTGAEVAPPRASVLVAQRDGRAVYSDVSHIRIGGMFGLFPFWITRLTTEPAACCPGWYRSDNGGTNPPPPPAAVTLGSDDTYEVVYGVPSADDVSAPRVNALRTQSLTTSTTCAGNALYLCPTSVVPLDGTSGTRPVLADDESLAYAGTDAGTVFAVDTAAHAVAWSAAVGAPVADSPALADGSLHVPTTGGGLVVLDAGTGERRWSAAAGTSVVAQPAVGGGVVFVASEGGLLAAYDAAGCGAATCAPLWTTSVGSEVTGGPIVDGGLVVVGTEDGHLVAYET